MYIAERTSVPIPFLPVCRIEERKLFADLVITLVDTVSSRPFTRPNFNPLRKYD